MNFCCHGTKNRFAFRNTVGEFIIAGVDPERGVLRFYYGFTACHRADWQNLIETCKEFSGLMNEVGISNIKISSHHMVRFCATCGADLSEFYGSDGGAIRDDDFLAKLKNKLSGK